jgi:hypothetical protein
MKYDAARPLIRTGDCILWKGNNLLSRTIRMFSEYSHASLVVRLAEYEELRERVYLVEALGSGLELRALSQRIKEYDGEAYLFQPSILTSKHEAKIRQIALDDCASGIRYDYGGLFGNLFGHVPQDAKRYFCSEHVWRCWQAAGLVPVARTAPRPGDIPVWKSGTLIRLEA